MFENYKISMFNRKGMLYIQFYIDGKLKQKSTRLKDTPQNRKLIKNEVIPQLLLKLKSGEFSQKKAREFDYYASIYLRQKEHIKSYFEYQNIVLKQLYPLFKNKKVDKITKGEIKEWINKRLLEISPKRLRHILNILASILDIALDYEHIQTNPARNIKLPPHKKIRQMQPFTEEEVKTLLNNAEGTLKYYLAIAFYTGMRPGEIIALTISDINLNEMYININKRVKKGAIDTPKTPNSIRKVPIFDELLPYLHELIQKAKNDKSLILFYTKSGRRYFSPDKLHNMWYKLLKKCNIKKRVLYNTRHTFATLSIKKDIPIYIVSQILGHKNIQETLQTYAKFINNEHLNINRQIFTLTDKTTDTHQQLRTI